MYHAMSKEKNDDAGKQVLWQQLSFINEVREGKQVDSVMMNGAKNPLNLIRQDYHHTLNKPTSERLLI